MWASKVMMSCQLLVPLLGSTLSLGFLNYNMIVNTICLTKGLEDRLTTQTQKAEHTLPESFHWELKGQYSLPTLPSF